MKLNQGEVVISLDGKEVVLKATLNATRVISRTYKGFGGALEALRTADFDAVVYMIRVGANMADRDARNLDERVYAQMGRDESAFGEILLQLIRYIRILQNGGRPLKDEPVEGDQEDAGDQQYKFGEEHHQGN